MLTDEVVPQIILVAAARGRERSLRRRRAHTHFALPSCALDAVYIDDRVACACVSLWTGLPCPFVGQTQAA